MTISAVPFALQNVPINADVVRQAVSSLIPDGGGLVKKGDLAVTQLGTPAMGVQVGVGRAWIDGTNLAHLSSQGYGKQGMYFILNDAAYNVTITTSNATNPRIDVIYAVTPDTAYAGASNAPDIAVATGTATAGASYPANAPSLPNNAIALAWIYVGANVTSITNANITQLTIPIIGGSARANGLVFENHVSSVSGAVSNAVINNIATFTFTAGHKYRIVWDTSHLGTNFSGSLFYMQIGLCAVGDAAASLTGITVLNGRTVANLVADNVTNYTGPITAYYAPSTNTTTQIKFVATRVLGTGTISTVGNGNETSDYLIYDDGAVI